MTPLDCQTCGACCCNPEENQKEGFVDWVEVSPRDILLRRRRTAKRLVIYNAAGMPHLRMDNNGRCAALRGRLGEDVSCSVYEIRPAPCRRLQAGSDRCLQYRRERGIDPPL